MRSERTVTVALIGLIGVLGASVIANWDQLFPGTRNAQERPQQPILRPDAPQQPIVRQELPQQPVSRPKDEKPNPPTSSVRPAPDAPVPGAQPSAPAGPKQYSDIGNASYEIWIGAPGYGSQALMQFSGKFTARWRYRQTAEWEDELKVEYLSPHRVILSVGGNDPQQRVWDLQFSEGFRDVQGSYKFQQKGGPLLVDAGVTGHRIE